MGFESSAMKAERPPSPERETLRKEYEYRDSEGKLIGKATVELADELIEVKRRDEEKDGEKEKNVLGIGRQLRSFVLDGEADGQPTRVDVLDLANQHGILIFIKDARSPKNAYDPSGEAILSDPLETPTDVGVLLHELGHADQWRDEHLEALTPLYGRKEGRQPFTSPYAPLKEVLAAAEKTVPGAEALVDEKTRSRLEELEARLNVVEEEKEQLEEGRAELIKSLGARSAEALAIYQRGEKIPEAFEKESRQINANIAGVEGRIRELEKEAAKIVRMQKRIMDEMMDVEAIMALPTQTLERNATARALKWLRTIRKQSGIDLFRPHAMESKALIGGKKRLEDCRSYVITGLRQGTSKVLPETSVLEELEEALRTYGAEKPGKIRPKPRQKNP